MTVHAGVVQWAPSTCMYEARRDPATSADGTFHFVPLAIIDLRPGFGLSSRLYPVLSSRHASPFGLVR